MELPIENKIEKANISQIDLLDFTHKQDINDFDMKGALWNELIVKEKEFRAFVKSYNWEEYKSKIVAIYCSVDSIIPAWAFMVIANSLINVGANVYYGTKEEVDSQIFFENLAKINLEQYIDQRVMVKGCSNIPNPNKAYLELTNLLVPHVKSLMFGEPCSAVPVFKRKYV